MSVPIAMDRRESRLDPYIFRTIPEAFRAVRGRQGLSEMGFSDKLRDFQCLEPLPEKEVRMYMSGYADGTRLSRSYLVKLQADSVVTIPQVADLFFATPTLLPFLLRTGLQLLIDGRDIAPWNEMSKGAKQVYFDAFFMILRELRMQLFSTEEERGHWMFSKLTEAQRITVATVLFETAADKKHPCMRQAQLALDAGWDQFLSPRPGGSDLR